MCFFTSAFLAKSEKPWNTSVPDEMELVMMLQTFTMSGEAGLRQWLAAGVDRKKAKGFKVLLEHTIKNASGRERSDCIVMLEVVDEHIRTLS